MLHELYPEILGEKQLLLRVMDSVATDLLEPAAEQMDDFLDSYSNILT